MSRIPAAIILAVLALFPATLPAQPVEPELHIARFSAGDLTNWKDQVVYGTKHATVYSLIQENGRTVLMAKATDAASGLIRRIDIDPKVYPLIKWSWKIDRTVKKGNERTKDGHDFGARLYVVFPRGFFSSTRAIEYVWGNVMHKGEMLRSPYSNNMVMIAVDTGDEQAGHWTFHKRNYVEDYRTAFGEDPPRVGAIAVMTDSDNTHESAVGYYSDISVLTAPREEGHKPKEPKPKEPLRKEQLPKEPPPVKEHPLREQQKKEPKPKELQKEHPNGNGHPVPPPAVPPSPPPAVPSSSPAAVPPVTPR